MGKSLGTRVPWGNMKVASFTLCKHCWRLTRPWMLYPPKKSAVSLAHFPRLCDLGIAFRWQLRMLNSFFSPKVLRLNVSHANVTLASGPVLFFFFFKCGPFLKSLRNLLLSTTNWHLPRAPPSDWTTRAFAKCLCGDWTLCSCSCWPSATAGGVQGGVRCSVLQGIWWNRSFSSVQFSHSVMSNSLRPCGLQHARPPCPSSTPRACSNSCPSKWWCYSTISSSVVPFSFHV